MPLPALSLALLLFWGKWQHNLFQIDFFFPLQTFSFLVSVCIQNWETQHRENICTKPYRMFKSSLGTPTLKAGEATLAGRWKALLPFSYMYNRLLIHQPSVMNIPQMHTLLFVLMAFWIKTIIIIILPRWQYLPSYLWFNKPSILTISNPSFLL